MLSGGGKLNYFGTKSLLEEHMEDVGECCWLNIRFQTVIIGPARAYDNSRTQEQNPVKIYKPLTKITNFWSSANVFFHPTVFRNVMSEHLS